MRALIIFSLVASVIVSCDTLDETQSFLSDLNQPPQINFNNNPDLPVLSDSIKIGLKSSQEKYHIALKVSDKNKNLREIIYSQLAGKGRLKQNGIDIVGNNVTFRSDSSLLEFDYYPDVYGIHKLGLTAIDNFNLKATVSIEIVSFDNLPPVTKFNWTRLGIRSRYEYEIKAGESFDRDAKYGGMIEEYEFTVQGKVLPILATTGNSFKTIFPDKGIYPVAVRVRDNDGKWSTLVEREISVD